MSNDTFPSFCNHDEWNTQLEILVKSLLPDESSKKADELYTLLKNCYDTGAELREIILGNEISSTIFPKFQYCDLLNKATHIGLDIPTYFNYKHCQAIIMIVGIDPLRTGDQLKSTISVGSPYALHSKSFRSLKNLYWNLVNTLAQRKYTIYLTDTFKLYFKQNNKESHDITEFIHPEKKNHDDIYQNILQKNIKSLSLT